jgi:GNAT superfamily N-acetyltransferase
VKLRDGGRALIRPVEPEDRERLARGFARLSPSSRYLRFHTAVNTLSEAQLRYLTDIDHRDHVAFGALDPDDPDAPGLGIARFVRLAAEPEVAEAAVTVLDEHQGRGVASALLAVLLREARRQGITTLRGYVLVDNQPMLRLFTDLGASRRYEGEGVYCVDVPVPDDLADLPDTPALRVVRAVAAQALPALSSDDPPVWA